MRPPVAALLLLVFIIPIAPGATAWHLADENPSERHGSRAGDPRFVDDAAKCHDEAAAAPETSCLVLYAHLFDFEETGAMTPQRPPDCAADIARGVSGTPHVRPFWDESRVRFLLVRGFVEYEGAECADGRFPHRSDAPERLVIARSADLRVHLHLSADTLEPAPSGSGSGPGPVPAAGTIPCLTVRATLRATEHGEPRVIATGETTKTIITAPLDGRGTPVPDPCPGADGTVRPTAVAEFVVDLGRARTTLSATERLVLDAEWHQWESAAEEDDYGFVQQQWNLHSGPEYANRLVIPVERSLQVSDLALSERRGQLQIQADATTSLGAHNIDSDDIRIALIGEDGTRIPLKGLASGWYPHVPRIWHRWDYTAAQLPPGAYTLQYTVSNWQHTEVVHKTASLWIASDGTWTPGRDPAPSAASSAGRDSIVIGILLLSIAALYTAAFASRRQV